MMKRSRHAHALATGFQQQCWQLVFSQQRELQGVEEQYSTGKINLG